MERRAPAPHRVAPHRDALHRVAPHRDALHRVALALLVTTLAALAAAPPAAAWSDAGHRVVAALAWERLSPEARDAAADLLLAAPEDSGIAALMPDAGTREERRRELFVAAATWPDLARGTSYHRGGWHYVNHFWRPGPDGRPVPVPELEAAPQNAVERLHVLSRSVVDPGEPAAQRAVDLAWILHVVGDLHQPLHTSARVTGHREERRGDKGGNTFLLHRRGWFDDRRWNLHAYWDRILELGHPRRFFEDDEAFVERMVEEVRSGAPEPPEGALRPGDFDAWAREGVALAQEVVYAPGLERHREPSAAYRAVALEISEERLKLAAHRLADLLERTLGGAER